MNKDRRIKGCYEIHQIWCDMDRVVGSSVFLCWDRSQGQTVCLRLRAVQASEINTPRRRLHPSLRLAFSTVSTWEVTTTRFILGGVSHAELLQTASEWIMGSHAKLRNKESMVQAESSHLGWKKRSWKPDEQNSVLLYWRNDWLSRKWVVLGGSIAVLLERAGETSHGDVTDLENKSQHHSKAH